MKREKSVGGFKTYYFAPQAAQLPVKRQNILAAMEMTESVADAYLLDLIDELSAQSRELAEPQASYSIFAHPQITPRPGLLSVNGATFNVGKLVASFLKNSEMMGVFVGTCGDKIERLAKKLMTEGHTLEGYIVDLAASELAEGIADYVHEEARNLAAAESLRITNRYSPGYCNWPVSDQHKLFSLIPGAECGIRLTPTALMLPVKSVSGIIGLGARVKEMGYKCRFCSDERCVMRKKL